MTSSIPTSFLPLTTTFTAPAGCFNGPWINKNVSTTWWKQGGNNVRQCFPSAFPFSDSSIVYSPGVCPAGWSSACDRTISRSGSTQTVVSCCPQSYECASTSRAVHDWEDQYGCASPLTVDTASWNISSDAPFVSSVYQLQVMIVEATTSSSPSTASSTPPTSAQPASTSVPTASNTGLSTPASSTSASAGLSKGATAGIAVGSILGAAILALLAYIAWKLHKKSQMKNEGHLALAQYPDYPSTARYEAPQHPNTIPTELEATGPTAVYEMKAQ